MTLLTATKGTFADLGSEYKDDEDVVDRKISCQREDVKEKLSFLSEEKYLTFLGRPTKIVPLHVSRNMGLNCDFSCKFYCDFYYKLYCEFYCDFYCEFIYCELYYYCDLYCKLH